MATIYNIHGKILFQDDNLSFKKLVEKNKFNLRGCNLEGAYLICANLTGANLRGCNLEGTYLSVADLTGANLRGANLRGANLRGSDLRGSNLRGTDLRGTDLTGTDLRGTDLRGADLRGADLRGADLSNSDLSRAIFQVFSKRNVSYILNSKDFENSDINKIIIKIGCKEKTIKKWDTWFNSNEEYETKRGTEDFRLIQANYIAVREYLKFMVKGEN